MNLKMYHTTPETLIMKMIQDVYNVINCYFIDNGLSNEMFIRLCGNIDKKREMLRGR